MYLRAALSVLPRPRPKVLPSTVVTFSSTAAVADVAAYNSVCGYTLSDFLPPLYPHVLAFGRTMRLMSGQRLPVPCGRAGAHRQPARPLRSPAAFRAAVLLGAGGGPSPAPARQQFDVVTTASLSSDGPVMWSETSTYLRRGASSAAAPDPASLVDGPAVAVWDVPASMAARPCRRLQPHTHLHVGRSTFGFKKPIAHGMWTKARLLASVQPASSFTVDVRCRAPIYLGSRVSLYSSGSSADVRGRNDRLHLTASFS